MPPDRIKSKHHARLIAKAYRNPRVRPSLIYANNATPQDVGIADEFACIIW